MDCEHEPLADTHRPVRASRTRSSRGADAGHPHAPGRRPAGGAGAARHPALPHGRQRSLRGRLPQRRPADAVPRLADEAGGPRAGSRRPCPTCRTSGTPARSGACGSSSRDLYGWREPITRRQLAAARRADPRAGRRPRLASRDPRPAEHPAHRHRARPARRRRGRRPAAVRAGVGLLHALPVGRVRHGALRAGALLGPLAREPLAHRRRRRGPPTERVIRTLDDVHAAVAHYVDSIPYDQILSTATHISTDIDLPPGHATPRWPRPWHGATGPGPAERDIYASYINEAFLTRAGEARRARSSSSSASAPSRCPSRPAAGCRSGPSPSWPR